MGDHTSPCRVLRAGIPFTIQHDWQHALRRPSSDKLVSQQRFRENEFWLLLHFADGSDEEYRVQFNYGDVTFSVHPTNEFYVADTANTVMISLNEDKSLARKDHSSSVNVTVDGKSYVVTAPEISLRACDPSDIPSTSRLALPRASAARLTTNASAIAYGNAKGYCAVEKLPYAAPPFDLPQSPTVLSGHVADINVASWFPSNKVVYTASSDMSLRVHDPSSGRCAAILRGHAAGITAAHAVGKGRHILTAARDASLWLWDIPTAATLAKASLPASANAVVILAVNLPTSTVSVTTIEGSTDTEGKLAVIACDNGVVYSCDVAAWTLKEVSRFALSGLPHSYTSGIKALCVCSWQDEGSSKQYVLVGGTDGLVMVLCVSSDDMSCTEVLQGRVDVSGADITACAAVNNHIFVGTSVGHVFSLRYIESETRFQHRGVFSGPVMEGIRSLSAVTVDDRVIVASACNDGFVRIASIPCDRS